MQLLVSKGLASVANWLSALPPNVDVASLQQLDLGTSVVHQLINANMSALDLVIVLTMSQTTRTAADRWFAAYAGDIWDRLRDYFLTTEHDAHNFRAVVVLLNNFLWPHLVAFIKPELPLAKQTQIVQTLQMLESSLIERAASDNITGYQTCASLMHKCVRARLQLQQYIRGKDVGLLVYDEIMSIVNRNSDQSLCEQHGFERAMLVYTTFTWAHLSALYGFPSGRNFSKPVQQPSDDPSTNPLHSSVFKQYVELCTHPGRRNDQGEHICDTRSGKTNVSSCYWSVVDMFQQINFALFDDVNIVRCHDLIFDSTCMQQFGQPDAEWCRGFINQPRRQALDFTDERASFGNDTFKLWQVVTPDAIFMPTTCPAALTAVLDDMLLGVNSIQSDECYQVLHEVCCVRNSNPFVQCYTKRSAYALPPLSAPPQYTTSNDSEPTEKLIWLYVCSTTLRLWFSMCGESITVHEVRALKRIEAWFQKCCLINTELTRQCWTSMPALARQFISSRWSWQSPPIQLALWGEFSKEIHAKTEPPSMVAIAPGTVHSNSSLAKAPVGPINSETLYFLHKHVCALRCLDDWRGFFMWRHSDAVAMAISWLKLNQHSCSGLGELLGNSIIADENYVGRLHDSGQCSSPRVWCDGVDDPLIGDVRLQLEIETYVSAMRMGIWNRVMTDQRHDVFLLECDKPYTNWPEVIMERLDDNDLWADECVVLPLMTRLACTYVGTKFLQDIVEASCTKLGFQYSIFQQTPTPYDTLHLTFDRIRVASVLKPYVTRLVNLILESHLCLPADVEACTSLAERNTRLQLQHSFVRQLVNLSALFSSHEVQVHYRHPSGSICEKCGHFDKFVVTDTLITTNIKKLKK